MNVFNLGKGDFNKLDMIVKRLLWREGFHGRQSSNERLYSNRNEGGRGLKSLKQAYSVIRVAWSNESQKEQISLKKKAEKEMRKVKINVSFEKGSVIIGKENYTEWKKG